MDDVDVANDISAEIVGNLDFDTAIGLMADDPAQQKFFAVIFVKLNQTDVAHGADSSLEKAKHGSRVRCGLQAFTEGTIGKALS